MSTAAVLAEAGSGDRRSDARYPIATDVSYEWKLKGKHLVSGRGRSVNMSSGGILLATEAPVPPGAEIALEISWPAKLDDSVPLNLHVVGRTVRVIGNHTAVAFRWHEFRTRAWHSRRVPGFLSPSKRG